MKNKILRIFILALSVRFVWFVFILIFNPNEGFLAIDSLGYLQIAENLKNYNSYSQGVYGHESFVPDVTRTPAFPFLLYLFSMFNAPLWSIILFQLVISSASCAITYFISKKLTNSEIISFFTTFIFVFDIPSICFSNYILTDTLFVFLLLLSITYAVKARSSKKIKFVLLSGSFLSLAALCRPMAAYLLIGYLFFLLDRVQYVYKVNMVRLLLFFVAFIFLLVPWLGRNYYVFKKPYLSTIAEVNLLFHTGANIRAIAEKKSIDKIQNEYWEISKKQFDWKQPSEAIRFADYSRKESLKILKEHPLAFIKIYAGSVFLYFIKPLRGQIDIQFGIRQDFNSLTGISDNRITSILHHPFQNTSLLTIILVLFQILLLLFVYLGILFLFLNFKKVVLNKPFIVFLLALVIYFALTSSITEFDARFRMPTTPLLIILSGCGYSLKVRKWYFLSFLKLKLGHN